MSHNSEVAVILKQLRESVENSSSKKEIMSSLEAASSFGPSLKYNNMVPYMLMLLGAGLFATCFFTDSAIRPWILQYGWYSLAAMAGLVFLPLSLVLHRIGELNTLSDRIFWKVSFLDNKLRTVDCKKVEPEIIGVFNGFNRGNHSNKITDAVESTDKDKFPFTYFHYHYVDKVVRYVRDGKQTRREVTYHHYDRSGLLVDVQCPPCLSVFGSGISMPRDRAVKYRPSFIEFTNKFRIGARSETDAARYISPVVQLALVNQLKRFRGLDVEVNARGQLLISVTPVLLNVRRKSSVTNPREYLDELSNHTELKALNEVLGLCEELLGQWALKEDRV